jgi:hypothetical protein
MRKRILGNRYDLISGIGRYVTALNSSASIGMNTNGYDNIR